MTTWSKRLVAKPVERERLAGIAAFPKESPATRVEVAPAMDRQVNAGIHVFSYSQLFSLGQRSSYYLDVDCIICDAMTNTA